MEFSQFLKDIGNRGFNTILGPDGMYLVSRAGKTVEVIVRKTCNPDEFVTFFDSAPFNSGNNMQAGTGNNNAQTAAQNNMQAGMGNNAQAGTQPGMGNQQQTGFTFGFGNTQPTYARFDPDNPHKAGIMGWFS